MARRGKVVRNSRRRVRSEDKGSEDSDEDYTVGEDEECDESDEYHSSFYGDESEDNFGEFGEEDKKVKNKVGRSKTRKGFPGRKKNGVDKPRNKKRVWYKEEDDEDYDDDGDEEFAPDEIDFVDDEDEPPEIKKNKKVGRTRSWEGGFVEVRNRKRNSKVFKMPARKKSRKIHRLRNKACSGNDTEFEKNPVVNEKSKTISGRKWRKFRADSDPDFKSSGSSDYEFTISEEEREQVREATKFCRSLATSLRSSTLSKRLQEEVLCQQRKFPGRKGKEKVEDLKNKASKQVCGSLKNDGEFDKNPVVEEKSKKISGRKRRRFIADSGSDFVSSSSSDYDYTISEEETEHMREASEFCRSLTTCLRSSTSSTRLQDEEEALCKQRKHPGRKGKEKLENLKNEVGKQVCGICLSGGGKKMVQGTLNCCSHYFCFACIMEWSKVESRCPLCKQRFVTISKPARSNTGFDLRTIVIQVPERDQVYQPSDEELRGYLDPYESVICTECHQGGDDALMLLCDLCDSPTHTYCVGLGRHVPEGNWYCEGCRPTALGSSNRQGPSPTPDQRTSNNLSVGSTPVNNFDLNEMYVPDTPLTQGTGHSQSPRRYIGHFEAASPSSGSGAFTVSERRRIQRQIHYMLNHRMRQFGVRNSGISATNLGSLFVPQINRSRELAPQPTMRLESVASHCTSFEGRLQNNTTPSANNRDPFSSILGHSRGQIMQNPTSTYVDGSVGGILQAELAGINSGINSILGFEQLHPCSNRSRIGADH